MSRGVARQDVRSGRAELRIVDHPAAKAAERIARRAASGGHVALAGGSTPRAAYELLAEKILDWSRCQLWFGDERCVTRDDERSNFRMVRQALLERLAGSEPAVHRIAGELGPHEAAQDYEQQLTQAFGGETPRLDLVVLGLGADGHCASLFPGQASLAERERLVVGVDRAGLEPFVPRVTLTLRAINAASEVIFLAVGTAKAESLARAYRGPQTPDIPASLVAPRRGSLTFLIDHDAAAVIEQEGA